MNFTYIENKEDLISLSLGSVLTRICKGRASIHCYAGKFPSKYKDDFIFFNPRNENEIYQILFRPKYKEDVWVLGDVSDCRIKETSSIILSHLKNNIETLKTFENSSKSSPLNFLLDTNQIKSLKKETVFTSIQRGELRWFKIIGNINDFPKEGGIYAEYKNRGLNFNKIIFGKDIGLDKHYDILRIKHLKDIKPDASLSYEARYDFKGQILVKGMLDDFIIESNLIRIFQLENEIKYHTGIEQSNPTEYFELIKNNGLFNKANV